MKKCGGSPAQYAVAVFMALLLTVPLLSIFIYLLLADDGTGRDIALTYAGGLGRFGIALDTGTRWNERLVYVGGLVFFGGLLAFFLWRLLVTGLPYIEYDQRRIIFHFSKKLQWTYAWEALPEALVEIAPVPRGEWLSLRYRDKQKKIAMYKSHRGYQELKLMMRQKGIFDAVRRKRSIF